ncbi:MAG: class I SAM-dependent methyltransferase [Clostridiaceae bacterium]|nr:class I SAM-dependent methyltransferase [Clostridiaceae bacterium]
MGFYEEIGRYYDYIFPVGESQLSFIEDSLKGRGISVLDVACGSGGYSVELAKMGYSVTAVDMEIEMINKLLEKAQKEKLDIKAYQADMRRLALVVDKKFDVLFCIGNSIVHLNNMDEISDVLKQMHGLLEQNGALVLQIINYDRIIESGISELPPIINEEEGLEFVRKYKYLKEDNIIDFNTSLILKNGDSTAVYNNSIKLFPILKEEFETALRKAGFDTLYTYGDFKHSPYTKDSYMLVIKAIKTK